jgi:signal transduction histidine kinase
MFPFMPNPPRNLSSVPLDDPARLSELRVLELVGPDSNEAFNRLTRLAVQLVGAESAAVTIIGAPNAYIQGATGAVPAGIEIPADQTICSRVARSGQPLIIEDTRHRDDLCNLFRAEKGVAISYLGVPLVTSTGHTVGALCCFGGQPLEWTAKQCEALEDLAASVVSEIELRRQLRAATERAESLLVANAELAEIAQARENFAEIASHELRTPLTSIMGSAQTLIDFGDDLPAADRNRLRGIIVDQSSRLERMIDGLLRTVRIDTGRAVRMPEIVPLGEALTEMTAQLGLAASVKVEADLEAVVDPDHLYQIFENLSTNADRYAGGLTHVSAHRSGDLIHVDFCDEGDGVDPEFAPRLFDRFSRGSSYERGTGLGLPIVRALARVGDGDVTYSPRAGGGSTFTLTMPVAPAGELPLAA